MLAATYLGPRQVRADRVPDAALRKPTDCVVRSSVTAICGSDLHTYHGANETYLKGAGNPPVLGHEYVGIVEEVGEAVTLIKKGDRVTGAFRSACGICDICRRGYAAMCPRGEMMGLDTPGAQAEAVRVPQPDEHGARFLDEYGLARVFMERKNWREAQSHLDAALETPSRAPAFLPWVYYRYAMIAQVLNDETKLLWAVQATIEADALVPGGTAAPTFARALLIQKHP